MKEKRERKEVPASPEQSNRQQEKYAKWQCVLTAVCAACCVGMFVLALSLVPEVRGLANQMETVLDNLERVTEQLAGMDLGGMVQNVDALVTTTQEGVERTMEQMNAIDFEALNRAIRNLSDVVEPLARFFNVFR